MSTMSLTDKHQQYDRAITLIQYYVQLMWLIFGAFLLTETVLLGAAAALAKDGPKAAILVVSGVGLLLSIPWWTSYRYNHALYLLRVAQARALEPEVGDFFEAGARLIDGKGFDAHFGRLRIPWSARVLSPNRAVLAMVALFFLAFSMIAVLCIFGYVPDA